MKNCLLIVLILFTLSGFAQTPGQANLHRLLDHPLVKALDKTFAGYSATFVANGIMVKATDVQGSNTNTYYVASLPMIGGEGPMDKIYKVYWSYFDTSKVYKFVPNSEVVPAMDIPVANIKWGMGVADYINIFGKPDTAMTYDSYSYSNLYTYHYLIDPRNPHIKKYYVAGIFYTKSHPVGEKVKDPVYLLRELHIGVKEWDITYFDPVKAIKYYPNPSNWHLEPERKE